MDVLVTCPCPGTPHPDGDTVTLRDTPSFQMGSQALGWASMPDAATPTGPEISTLFIRQGITAWTFVDEDGELRPVNEEGLDWFLDDFARAYPIAEATSQLYTDAIFIPLRASMQKASTPKKAARRSSNSGQTEASTSAT